MTSLEQDATHAQASDFVREFPLRACAFTTLTGLDANTSISQLVDISSLHAGRVEWGVLLGSADRPRYPSRAQIDTFADARQQHDSLKMALHLCGRFALGWVDGNPEMVELASRFDRIQLNVNGSDKRLDKEALRAALDEGRHTGVITQHNTANETLTAFLSDCPNHALLFDASGGRGVAPLEWPLPVDGKVCGYAGGMGPGLVEKQLRQIATLANGPFWIDMENALRDSSDRLDLSRCARVLSEVDAWRQSLVLELSSFVSNADTARAPSVS